MDQYSHCPRCQNRTFAKLETYSHCIDCLYFEDRYFDDDGAYFETCVAEALLDENCQAVEPQLDEIEAKNDTAS